MHHKPDWPQKIQLGLGSQSKELDRRRSYESAGRNVPGDPAKGAPQSATLAERAAPPELIGIFLDRFLGIYAE